MNRTQRYRKKQTKKFRRGTRSRTHTGKDFETRKTSKMYRRKAFRRRFGRDTILPPLFPFVGGSKQNHSARQMNIKFKTTMTNLAPISKRALSRNGPYIDAHFKNIDSKNPIGQTYYLRPVSNYNSKTKTLTIHLNKTQPTVHMNSNSVSEKVLYSGTIKIYGFQYGKYNPNSIVDVNMTLYNKTGKDLIGFHIHDGEMITKKPYAGFTNFGPIVVFLYTTLYWNKKKEESAFPLPSDDVTPMTNFTLH